MADKSKMMVATDRGECQKLKDLMEDATRMVVVTTSSTNGKDETAEIPVGVVGMHPLLLAASCSGHWEALSFLLNREDAQEGPSVQPSQVFLDHLEAYTSSHSSVLVENSDDIEEGGDMPSLFIESLLEGLTIEGDTVLHVVSKHGDDHCYLKCADLIYGKAKHLLLKKNYNGNTPLHCAAKAGNSKMVSRLIDLASNTYTSEGNNDRGVECLLRMENDSKETALHEAVRVGDNSMVELLLTCDSELARFPQEGTSPLYLAILLEKDVIAQTLYDMSKENILSYSGPNGQNALHVAVLRSKAMTGLLLKWNKNLTTHGDVNGSTPLHFASSHTVANNNWVYLKKVLEANGAPLYQPDNCGMFPVHVAASVGEVNAIKFFVQRYPSIAGLRDKRGRTFLHVAVENKELNVVSYACSNRSLAWILNMQDNDGNTALHLAVEAAHLMMFCRLFGNRRVQLNLVNVKGQTPRDISHNKIPPGMYINQSTQEKICLSLEQAGAMNGCCRQDHFRDNYKDIHQLKSNGERNELKKLKEDTQTKAIGSVLIATVTFGATFAVPGGYTNGGTPTLAGRYAFDAFVIANTLAFILSSIATTSLLYSGSPFLNTLSRRAFLKAAIYCMRTSIACLIATFTLAMYMVLAPVARSTAVVVCAISPLVVLCNNIHYWVNRLVLTRSYFVRMGPIWTLRYHAAAILFYSVVEFWPLIFIFAWASHGRAT